MRMPIAGDNDWLLPGPIRHSSEPTRRILMSDIVGLDDVESLLQVHSRAECLVACASEDSAPQLRLAIVPLPQCTELDCCLHWQAIAIFWSVDCNLKNVLAGEANNAVFDMWVGVLDPRRDGVLRSRCRHAGDGCDCVYG